MIRLAVVVTTNVGLQNEAPLHYADSDGDRVAAVLSELGSFETEHIFRAADATVDDLTEAIRQATLTASHLESTGSEVALLVYYTGHADTDGLHLHGETMSLKELKAAARVVPASQRVFAVDACQSGQLLRTKGSTLVEMPAQTVDFTPPEGEAWLTSSGAEQSSFEVDQRRGALFSHYFVSGARGAADVDGDGIVHLGELADFVRGQTTQTAAKLGYLQEPRFAGGIDDFVISDLSRSDEGLVVSGPLADPVLVVDRSDASVAAELPSGAGGRLALPAGRYQLLALRRSGLHVADVTVGGGYRTVQSEELRETRGVRTKGGLVQRRPWALSLGYRAVVAQQRPDSHGAWLAADRTLGRGHHLTVGAGYAAGSFQTTWTSGSEQRWDLRADWTYDLVWRKVRAGPGLRLGGGWIGQEAARRTDTPWGRWFARTDARHQATVGVGDVRGLFAVSVPFVDVELRTVLGIGATTFLGESVQVRPAGDLSIGMAVPL